MVYFLHCNSQAAVNNGRHFFPGYKMAKVIKTVGKVRRSYGKLKDVLEVPNLIDIQLDSYEWFLQRAAKKKSEQGLQAVFRQIFPIESNDGNVILDFKEYAFGEIKYDEAQAREKSQTYAIPLKATLLLIFKDTGEVHEKEIYMGDLPLMTERGTFIINGAERVVVSQIHMSPGVIFSKNDRMAVYEAKIIPEKGAWLEFELDYKKELIHVRIDRKRKILFTTFLMALGYTKEDEIMSLFYDVLDKKIDKLNPEALEAMSGTRLARDIVDPTSEGEILFPAGAKLFGKDIEKLQELGIKVIPVLDLSKLKDDECLLNTLAKTKDEARTREEAISRVHNVIKPGEPSTIENAEKEINKLFFDLKRYDLGEVGRYKFNLKLYNDKNRSVENVFNKEDIIETVRYLVKVYRGIGSIDDIDHLGTRRIRSIGELLMNQLKLGFMRMERSIKERMSSDDREELKPQKIISIKPLTAIIKEFFGSSQLSQFMDQTNPLSELTHKRRLNALGPGGLTRDRAGFEVRDVHHTHYGRMCPIETPEGPNIGLIMSLSSYAKVNSYGFLETPYRKCENGRATDQIEYLDAIREEHYKIAQANEPLDGKGRFTNEFMTVRHRGEYPLIKATEADYMDVSPKQLISVSTALIPFLEHDDANRALMGSNMQRQAVPLMFPQAPVVGTGLEGRVAKDSRVCVQAKRDGVVTKVSATEITIEPKNAKNKSDVDTYKLIKYRRSNQDTCINQKIIAYKGQEVQAGDVLADGPACDQGELALGRNVLVAVTTWNGYNYEDAILLSENIVKYDVFSSIHITEFSIEARETKLGKEEITRDIPNVGEEMFRNLDENGIIRIGAKVKPGDMLVGRVTPKGETELTPEFKLLHSIFGEKSRDVRDTSLYLAHGSSGTIIDVRVFSREDGDELAPGVEQCVKVYVATKRKLNEGDKMAGRHGNKGVVSRIMPIEDMPFMADGTPVDIVLNPLGVPSRMNLGQILETLLGWAATKKGETIATPVFEGATFDEIRESLKEVGLSEYGRVQLYDGQTGEPFENEVTCGVLYMIKLSHMVDDKMHARSTGPYSLVTQQPLGGKAQFGGQRLGEMEVWALEAYGAANTLQELLTVKSDDMMGRARIYEAIVKGDYQATPSIPESFNVLVQELRGLGLDMRIYDREGDEIALTEKDEKICESKRAEKAVGNT